MAIGNRRAWHRVEQWWAKASWWIISHFSEHCLLLKPNKFGTNLLEDILAIHQLWAAQQANSQNTPCTLSESPNHWLVTPSAPSLKRAQTNLRETQSLNIETQVEFSKDFLKLLIANGAPFLFANNSETHIFAAKWITQGAMIPDRKKLSSWILDNEVKVMEDQVKLNIQGKVSTRQCDRWKNSAKKSVVSTMVTIENEVSYLFENWFQWLIEGCCRLIWSTHIIWQRSPRWVTGCLSS